MIRIRRARVLSVDERHVGYSKLTVQVGEEKQQAINYDFLTGSVGQGDFVILNTTAVHAGVGSGGYHFVIYVEGNDYLNSPEEGHIFKLRYTPQQIKVQVAEEEESPTHDLVANCADLAGLPVLAGALHSQLTPAVLGIRAFAPPQTRIAYIMTDGGCLPLAFSQQVRFLKEKGLIDATITCGHAFGGDYEAVNIYSALIVAKAVAKADYAIVCMGPGIVGTNTKWGTTALEQASILHAVSTLKGIPIAILRLSFADPRPRHYGVSHHTLTVLSQGVHVPVHVSLPQLEGERRAHVYSQLEGAGLTSRHQITELATDFLTGYLEEYGHLLNTMGRSYGQDPEFFMAAAASGALAVSLAQPSPPKGERT